MMANAIFLRRFLAMAVMVLSVAVTAWGTPKTGILLNTLPEPAEDGAYEIGNTAYTVAPSAFQSQASDGIGYIDWASLREKGLPNGAKVRLTGGVALYAVPEDVVLDFSVVKDMLILSADDLNRVLDAGEVGAGRGLCYMPVKGIQKASEEAGAVVTFLPSGETKVGRPAVVEGYWGVGKDNGVEFTYGLSGAGTVTLSGFGILASIPGPLNFAGAINQGASQQGQQVLISSPGAVSTIGSFESNNYGGAGGKAQQLVYLPARGADDPPCTLVITNFNPNEVGGLVDGADKFRRWGSQLCTCSNNTIRIWNLIKRGPIGLVAYTTSHYKNNAIPLFDLGFANFEIGGGTEFMNCSPTYNVSPNANVKFTGKNIEYAGNLITVNYSGESNVVNRGTLDFSTIAGYPNNLSVRGYNPWNLPRTVTTRAGLEQKTTVSVSDDRWLMPFDFGAETEDEIDVARCETNCKLDIPPSGTVIVSNATLSATAVYPRHWTEYPILTCKSDGETVFADWSVQTAGEWGRVQVQKVVKSTGLYVKIRDPQGLMLIFR